LVAGDDVIASALLLAPWPVADRGPAGGAVGPSTAPATAPSDETPQQPENTFVVNPVDPVGLPEPEPAPKAKTVAITPPTSAFDATPWIAIAAIAVLLVLGYYFVFVRHPWGFKR